MNNRKLIGVIILYPEGAYQQRILDGIITQCKELDYDIAVFTPLIRLNHNYFEYLSGELNIYEMINFDLLDGVVVATIPITDTAIPNLVNHIVDKLKQECRKPVVSIDMPLADYETIYTDDRTAFSIITAHMLDVHHCKRIYFLNGFENYSVSQNRLLGFMDELEKRGIAVDEDNIFNGDFWYSGGEELAEKIAGGELAVPDAVICANDYMAIGLANKLISHGIKVPEQVMITGYDYTQEAVINDPTITSFIPDANGAGAKAVMVIHRMIEPDTDKVCSASVTADGLKICKSCGCRENVNNIKQALSNSLYSSNHNYSIQDNADIGFLLESYMFENLTGVENPDDCLHKICDFTYLIRPYENFYMCLTEDWLNTDVKLTNGYPPKMKTVIHAITQKDSDWLSDGSFYDNSPIHTFDTALMYPAIWNDRSEPAVFYFTPLHYREYTLGYSVLQCSLTQKNIIDIVYRNWIRYVNNALEMTRVQNRLLSFSERDEMTGLMNRRGMERRCKELSAAASFSDAYLVFVIDMDGLKVINDTYGHAEGDYALNAIAAAVRIMARNTEVCVRAGGDEFYVIGIGDYSFADPLIRMQKFNQALSEENSSSGKPYEISASIGSCCEAVSSGISLEDAIHLADGRMYENKIKRKKQRKS